MTTNETQHKLCINCKHIGRNGSGDTKRYRCFAPQNVRRKEIDLVTGDNVTLYCAETCYEARQAGWCGAGAAWFEEAPPKFNEPGNLMPGSDARRQATAADLLSQLDSMK